MPLRFMVRIAVLAGLPLLQSGIYGAFAPSFAAIAATLVGPAATLTAPTSDRISIAVSGQGPDVILIPGLASGGQVWDATVAHIKATHRVHVVQVAGFAGSPAGGNGGGPVFAPVVAAIHDYITVNHLQGAAMIGHSFGGLIAMTLGVDHPGDAGRILIVDALPYTGLMFGASATPAMVEPQVRMMRDQLLAGTQEDYAAAEPAQMARLIKSRDAAATAAIAAASASDRRVVAQALYEDMTIDLRADLPRIVVPVTMLYPWDETSGAPQQMFDALYLNAFKTLPHRKVERIDGSYHFIMIDQPAVFLEKVDVFLAG